MCKILHTLPRGGGVLDQPSGEMMRLERIFAAFDEYEDLQRKKADSRRKIREQTA